MMVLYSGTTCPFSHRCRFVLFEKGMDFEIRDVDLYNKPEDISVMNPYGQVPILVERDLILYESNIINEYIDERFPHPQLMPGDPVDRVIAIYARENGQGMAFPQVVHGAGKSLNPAASRAPSQADGTRAGDLEVKLVPLVSASPSHSDAETPEPPPGNRPKPTLTRVK